MKIIICGSMRLSKEMLAVRNKLVAFGHEVILPRHTEEYARLETLTEVHSGSAQRKIENDLIRDYYQVIAHNDAVLVVNGELNGIKSYIGGNSFLEMGFAHVLNKKIYLLNKIPESSFKDEIVAMRPLVLFGDLGDIK